MAANTTNPTTDNANGDKKEKPKTMSQTIHEWMENPHTRDPLVRVLAGYMSADTFIAQCRIAAGNPDVAKCSAASLFQAFLECAQMGLLPGTHHKHVALIPRDGVVTVTVQWQGYKFILEQQPGVKRVTPVLVHDLDTFAINEGAVTHNFDPFNDARVFTHPDEVKKDGTSGLRGGYLKIEYDGGEVEYHFVSAAKINRNRSAAQTQAIWKKWFPEMCSKTVLRDAWARRVIPVSPEIAGALAATDAADNRQLGYDPARAALPDHADTDAVPSMTAPEGVPVVVGSARASLGLAPDAPKQEGQLPLG